ncbi:hypothetical protein KTT58_07265 [Pseudomonas viridiflava]|uniref:hypothetical protein n=1 Tax=Pseudomonas viridiflava TaxID=33069 RepID=UPI001C2D8095|nr:hypothetical protein [Pseudomonas viridiflava]MBV1812533.1 hypothetical protein [Pseudomonas viridiflava]
MSLNLVVVPSDSKGEPVRSELVKLWYVMEGDHVHCSCPTPELALLMIEKMKSAFDLDKDLSRQKLLKKAKVINETEEAKKAREAKELEELKELKEHYYIEIDSELAYRARYNAKLYMNTQNLEKSKMKKPKI